MSAGIFAPSDPLLLAADRLEFGQTVRPRWDDIARPEQLAPAGDWFIWLILAGRGWGKSKSSAEWAAKKARRYPGCRIALVAATFSDARDTMVEGESGLLSCFEDSELRGGSRDGAWNRSLGELFLKNGSRFKTFSSEKPWRLRGPQFHFACADEGAFWVDASKGVAADTTWSNLRIATRLPPRRDWDDEYRTQICVATTPRPVALLRSDDPDPAKAGLMQQETTVITRGRTSENLANLSDTYRAQVIAPLEGTRLGRQELNGELLDGDENALWSRDLLDSIQVDTIPGGNAEQSGFRRCVIGVDPSDGGTDSDEQAYTVTGIAGDGLLYVAESYGGKTGPVPFLRRVVEAARRWNATVVLEKNHGGAYLVATLRQVMKELEITVPYTVVHASQSKRTRAEPVAALYERGVVRHVNGPHASLEAQMTTFTGAAGESSPDKLDSLCWSIHPFLDQTFGPQTTRAPGPRQWAGAADLARIGTPPRSRRDPRPPEQPDTADPWDADSFAPQPDTPRRRGNVRSWR